MIGGLTKRQRKLLDFIRAYIAEHDGVSPSFDEMRDGIGLKSKSGVHRLIGALEERGFVIRHPNLVRAVSLVSEASEFERGRAVGQLATRDTISERIERAREAGFRAGRVEGLREGYGNGYRACVKDMGRRMTGSAA